MSVKRYEMKTTYRGHESWDSLEEDEEGSYVDYEDYVALEQNLTDMAVQLANAESKCREMAADNAALKEVVSGVNSELYGQGFEVSGWHLNGALEPLDNWFTDNGWGMPETPATDAFLAEVRAQVWIEGSEPEEFGRYWVRYETDVGPQYCSAKWMEHNFCAGSNTNIHKIWLADHSRSINSLRGVTHYTKLPDSLEGAAQ